VNPIEGKELAIAIAQVLEDQRGEDIVVLNLEGLSNIADYFVVCSGNSAPHLKALRREVLERLKSEHGVEAYHKDGMPDSQWVLVDFVDVIVHIFHPEKREYYALEDLWADAPEVKWKKSQ